MTNTNLRDKCSINTNRDGDTFVGIKSIGGNISVHFPIGYNLSCDEKELRKDILLLLNTIASTTKHTESNLPDRDDDADEYGEPIQAYLEIIQDFINRGYYTEREVEYKVAKRGKISWNRTIKNVKPIISRTNLFYLDYVVRDSSINQQQLITMIHEYCVYESFNRIGWIFTNYVPPKPSIQRNDKVFLSVLKEKLGKTFNDKNKQLFKAMIKVLEHLYNSSSEDFIFGTYRFEYVWEALIDKVFGVENKTDYFPKTTWNIAGRKYDNASLEPDSIMLYEDKIYVLDAKYYKYGDTHYWGHLPESTSINKQITYGEYIANNKAEGRTVYNAFLMPFNASDPFWNANLITTIGSATGNWRLNTKEYEHIQGIMLDVKHLMKISVRHSNSDIKMLAESIEGAFTA